MASFLALSAGIGCVAWFSASLVALACRASGPPSARACDARTGRPLRIRRDRRRSSRGRRVSDVRG